MASAEHFDEDWTKATSDELSVDSGVNFTSQAGEDERISDELMQYIVQLGEVHS
jgi:hypothetical protein